MNIFDNKNLANMTESMKSMYDGFYGNLDKLKAEWKLCDSEYKEAIKFVTGTEGDYNARSIMHDISNYWIRRRQALEYVLPDEILKEFENNS